MDVSIFSLFSFRENVTLMRNTSDNLFSNRNKLE